MNLIFVKHCKNGFGKSILDRHIPKNFMANPLASRRCQISDRNLPARVYSQLSNTKYTNDEMGVWMVLPCTTHSTIIRRLLVVFFAFRKSSVNITIGVLNTSHNSLKCVRFLSLLTPALCMLCFALLCYIYYVFMLVLFVFLR